MTTSHPNHLLDRLRSNVLHILAGRDDKCDVCHTILPCSNHAYHINHMTGQSHCPQHHTRNRLSDYQMETKNATLWTNQCFHLQTPEPLAKQRLQQTVSLPAFSSNQQQQQQHIKLSNRPLPRTPRLGREKQDHKVSAEKSFLLRKSSEGSQIKMRRKEPLGRTTVHSFSNKSSHSKDLLRTRLFEDHIYEEIDEVVSGSVYSDDTNDSGISGKEPEENSFLSLISTTRRQNLRYYGCTGWDFGTERV